MRAAAAAAVLLACFSPARAQECPKGTVAVAGGGCVRDMSGAGGPFMDMRGGHFKGARCPPGTRRVESALGFRCVMDGGDAGRPPRGRGRRARPRLDEDDAPAPGLPQAAAPAAPQVPPAPEPEAPPPGPPKEFVPFRGKGVLLSLPRGWHVTDAWSDEVPTVYVELDAKRRGKPVTMLVSRLSPGQEGYETLADAVAKEKDYQGAKEAPGRAVSGMRARQTVVPGESRSAYVDAGAGVYYLLSYSAPKDVFSLYEPAYEKLLASARFGRP